MRIAVIGTGYVGLVTGTCFSDVGHEVTCVDIDAEKVRRLREGQLPIYEPGLAELVLRNLAARRLSFTTDTDLAVGNADFVFVAVGTPQAATGGADLSALMNAIDGIARSLAEHAIVILKSTVPVGTHARVVAWLHDLTGRDCQVASNPEFLKEGAAINDFLWPDRIVIGVSDQATADPLRQLYAPFLRSEKPLLVMSPESAEMTKYTANAALAAKVSFINEMANLCERLGADINDVRRGIGHDRRIGFPFFFPGIGYGGSCFPKDVRALAELAEHHDLFPEMLHSVDRVNERQKQIMIDKVTRYYQGRLSGRTFAVWGLTFKPRTDDLREAPALVIVEALLAAGAALQVHDPVALSHVRDLFGDTLTYCPQQLDALNGADALLVLTEWHDYLRPNLGELHRRLKRAVVFDGRNIYEPEQMRREGFDYVSIGRKNVLAATEQDSTLSYASER